MPSDTWSMCKPKPNYLTYSTDGLKSTSGGKNSNF